jgi:RES domain-containing protein
VRLWRLTRVGQTSLDGAGASRHGGRYSPQGAPVVSFASEAGLAVLVTLRYLPADPADAPDDYVLGWTEIDAVPERVSDEDGDDAIRDRVAAWLDERRSLLAAVRSQVLPEADVVLMNPLHPDAAAVPSLVTRPFSFAECLHTPPMIARYSADLDAVQRSADADHRGHTSRAHDSRAAGP